MKRSIVLVAAAIVVVLLGGGVWHVIADRRAQQEELQRAAAQRVPAPLQFGADEVLLVQRHSLSLGVPVSGALRALNSAMVKARVGGELQGLTVREGDSVEAGQEVARIDPSESRFRLHQAQQQAEAAKSQVDIQQRQHSNNRALVDQGFISATALATSQASLEAARSSYQAAVAAADVARKALDDTVLRSPISGLVAQRLAQPGERVSIDARIIEVVDLSLLELEALISAADSVAVRVGQKARLDIAGTPGPVSAIVVRINPSAQAGSRAVPVYLRVDQAAGAPLRQGIFVQGMLDTGRAERLAVPLDAVRTDKPVPYLQTIRNGQVVHVPVQTATRAVVDGQTLVAVAGVAEGTPVIAGRIGLLREGTAAVSAALAPASRAAR
ncbi:efflux RND transporter periplasmic adaptor subunit [Verminephrobacter eiseniae]|uniref:Efflux transporter, RND family, MFP subunit n=1 Tax=Verminephrobacter eiseniae (strain EF01-2) TaxID=391735 RepID=A1WKD7_VEREI|nr:efflux RND transporter periplasmic adaptor subunit [Verminephrobacter eiseniae]ABM58094.1 efflux transporter, RND family, MFP subunit [Verminephrobacter eiseniae EF01-2]MCW5283699.1 efflux RND transporter periplasmic adaptor subunit [Verminephrobacter eiseniae]MCW5301409.1 efflux RND transporter periplasmic adaptor subunit [Verminephrobacter eiseniae]MCW8179916.1 efflux RND transporter periplasmic adaptor subunit [Verminephrobacter eiseniae]MCW8188803.1 efflux RND transporter periplasmic ad